MSEEPKLYRDSVSLDVDLDPFCAALMDTSEFQRLARIKQLGFTDFVYRGATHTRFSHVVGTYAKTLQLFAAIEDNHNRYHWIHPGHYLPSIFGGVIKPSGIHAATLPRGLHSCTT